VRRLTRRLPVEPDASYPGAMSRALGDAERAVKRAQAAFESSTDRNWEELARTLRGRVQAQRSELAELHKLIRSLRAEAHYWRSEAEKHVSKHPGSHAPSADHARAIPDDTPAVHHFGTRESEEA
jgi:hypothetical protein